MVYFVRSCRMRNGYFRRLISSTIDVDRYALLLRSLKVAGRQGAIASRTRMAKRAAAVMNPPSSPNMGPREDT
jgi:hypothetical protein